MRSLLPFALLAAALVPNTLRAAIPDAVPYQGRIAVTGTAFTGTGYFKFAVYQHANGNFTPAKATATISGGFLTIVQVNSGGTGYSATGVTVSFTGGGGSGATATATVVNGAITAITVTATGSGYTSAPTVVITDPAAPAQLWNNAAGATTAALAEPASAVSLPVTNGLFAMGLGDTSIANMATLPSSLAPATGQRAFVRVWFSQSGNAGTFQALSPDTELRSVPFAREAANTASIGGVSLANLPQLNAANTFTHVNGLTVTGSGPSLDPATFSWIPATGVTVPLTGAGTRMEFIPGYSAFRAGTATDTQWNAANIGLYSTALGYDTTASGYSSTALGVGTIASGIVSTALGYHTTASGIISTALGHSTTASGYTSTAMGVRTTASGDYSTAMGRSSKANGSDSTAAGYSTTANGDSATTFGASTTASGYASTAMGDNTSAPSYAETAFGCFSTTYTPDSLGSWSAGDRLLVVGNGTGDTARSDAFIIFKNGNATLKGTLTQLSDRNAKTDIVAVDTAAVLAGVASLPIATWKYKTDTATHLGPMAQDFSEAFELGDTNTGIATVDADGVALAAIQELKKQLDAKEARLADVEADNAALAVDNAELAKENGQIKAALAKLAARLTALEAKRP
jgi:hypothetical protein